MNDISTINVNKPNKFGILIKLNESSSLEKYKDTRGYTGKLVLSEIIAKNLRLNKEDEKNLLEGLSNNNRALVGDYYYDIAQSKVYKLLHSLRAYKTEISDCIYVKVEGKSR